MTEQNNTLVILQSSNIKVTDKQQAAMYYMRKRNRDERQSRYENRQAFASDVSSLISTNPGEFALYEDGVRMTVEATRDAARASNTQPIFDVFEIPLT